MPNRNVAASEIQLLNQLHRIPSIVHFSVGWCKNCFQKKLNISLTSFADESFKKSGGRRPIVKKYINISNNNGQVAVASRSAKILYHPQPTGTLYFIKGFRNSLTKHPNKLI